MNYNHSIELSLILIHKLNIESYEAIATHILDKLMKVTLMAIDLYPNQENLLLSAIQIILYIMIECSHSVLQLVSFERNKCIQLVMQSMNNFESNDNNSDIFHPFNKNYSIIVENILNIWKSNFSLKPIYVKTLLEIIKLSVRYKKIYYKLLEYCLIDYLIIMNGSNETIEILFKKRLFDLIFFCLNVSFQVFV
jgi:hypothetical protein